MAPVVPSGQFDAAPTKSPAQNVYDIATSRPVAILLRSGKTPSGHEVRCQVRRLVRRIRSHWPTTKLTIRGDGHYGRPEVMAWCEANAVDYIFGLPGNAVLSRLLEEAADDVRVRRAEGQVPVLRRYAELRYGAKSWGCKRRVSARIEATALGLDIRCVVTNLRTGTAEWLYDTLFCARGQAENLIKLHSAGPGRHHRRDAGGHRERLHTRSRRAKSRAGGGGPGRDAWGRDRSGLDPGRRRYPVHREHAYAR
jgi:hypothetical protein